MLIIFGDFIEYKSHSLNRQEYIYTLFIIMKMKYIMKNTQLYLIYISNTTAQMPRRIKTSVTGTTVSVIELSTINKNTVPMAHKTTKHNSF